MLVLSRKVGEAILIGDEIEVTVVRVGQNAVRLGIQAPAAYRIVRGEISELAARSPRAEGDPKQVSSSSASGRGDS